MEQAIETRELIVLDGLGVIVRGTYHKASLSNPTNPRPIGVLIVSSLSPTRAAAGDSAVYWADAFAQHGYPSFRLDLPGFGDSDGEPPKELLNFINTGGYASITASKVKELMAQFGLSGVVIVGLCAGAVSAIYTAAASRDCKGVVLMDPYFHLPIVNPSKLWQKLTGRVSRSGLGRGISKTYDHLKALRARLLGNRPPANANLLLLSRWKNLASTGIPILIFKAPDNATQRGEFDYLKHILELAGRKNQVVVQVIKGAGHTFSNSVGRLAVRQHTEHWLDTYFPLAGHEELTVNKLCVEAKDHRGYTACKEGLRS